jgi:arginase family enzyme
MARYGPQFGPDITFLGIVRCDGADPATYPGADVVILGAPSDGCSRSGARFGPQYIRQICDLAHDGSRPSLVPCADGLTDLRVYDAGDVEMFSGDAARSVRDLQAAVHAVTPTGAIPLDGR